MCESGKQYYEGKSCGTRMDQLKRLIWVLIVWVSILSVGLGASIALHIIFHQGSDIKNPSPSDDRMAHSKLTTYDSFEPDKNDGTEQHLLWTKKNHAHKSTTIKIEDDGNYFLFLRVTLQSKNQGMHYTITVEKKPETNNATGILVGHINGTENSTGFMGIGVILSQNTLINVICRPPGKLDNKNTYLGLIKF